MTVVRNPPWMASAAKTSRLPTLAWLLPALAVAAVAGTSNLAAELPFVGVVVAVAGVALVVSWHQPLPRPLADRADLGASALAARAGVLATLGWAMTVNMSGVRVAAAVSLSDAFLVLALGLLVVADTRHIRLPRHLLWSVGSLAALGVLTTVLPEPPGLTGRLSDSESALVLFRFLLAIAGVPALLLLVSTVAGGLRRTFMAWLAGATVVALIAILEAFAGFSAAGWTGLHFPGRAASLTTHPNSLGLVCGFLAAGAVALTEPGRRAWSATMYGIATIGLVGSAASGSRAGTFSVVLGVTIVEWVRRDGSSRLRVAVAATGVLAAAGLFLTQQPLAEALPGPFSELAIVDRLLEVDSDVAASDLERAERLSRTVEASTIRPVTGLGYQFARFGHNVPLQLVLASGLLGLFAFLLVPFTATTQVLRGGRWRRVGGIGLAGAACIITWLVFGLSQNTVYERWVYVPIGFAIAAVAEPKLADALDRPRGQS